MSVVYKKHLEGVRWTKSLQKVLQEALSKSASDNTPTCRSSSSLDDESFVSPLTTKQAQSVLEHFHPQTAEFVPIIVLRSLAALLGDDAVDQALLEGTSLVFTPPPTVELTQEQVRFRKRMERLRLQQEENRYSKLTSNLGKPVADDVTTRSMTYAASIGLNMIVAPLSFGCFMYFFGGGILDYIWPRVEDPRFAHAPDVRKVIVAVISGVIMLFIEMILFVIRTHEMDKAMRRKARTNTRPSPFGFYSADMIKSYKDE